MQVADLLGQYANALAHAPKAPSAKAGGTATQNLVSEFTQMQEGAVFEGSVNSIDGSKILLGLGNGQTISARLEGSVDLMLGQSVFFQVKSNDGATIAIKPFMGGQAFNPTIQKALDAAGMEMTKDTIDMVNRMMEEGMPIDKQSLAAMRHTLMQNPHVSMHTAITMSKLGIPVNDQMAAQFENYQNSRHSILNEMGRVMDGLLDVYAKAPGGASGLMRLNQQILSILQADGGVLQGEGLFTEASGAAQAEGPQQLVDGQGIAGKQLAQALGQDAQAGEAVGALAGKADEASGAQAGQVSGALAGEASGAFAGEAAGAFAGEAGQASNTLAGETAGILVEDAVTQAAEGKDSAQPRQLAELLSKRQLAQLEAQLKETFPKSENLKLNAQLTAKEFLDGKSTV